MIKRLLLFLLLLLPAPVCAESIFEDFNDGSFDAGVWAQLSTTATVRNNRLEMDSNSTSGIVTLSSYTVQGSSFSAVLYTSGTIAWQEVAMYVSPASADPYNSHKWYRFVLYSPGDADNNMAIQRWGSSGYTTLSSFGVSKSTHSVLFNISSTDTVKMYIDDVLTVTEQKDFSENDVYVHINAGTNSGTSISWVDDILIDLYEEPAESIVFKRHLRFGGR